MLFKIWFIFGFVCCNTNDVNLRKVFLEKGVNEDIKLVVN